MSDILTHTAEGISQLIVETLVDDAIVRATSDATDIQITYEIPAQINSPALIPEGDALRFVNANAVRVIVPETLAVVVQEALGNLRVQGLAGNVNLAAVHGDLRLEALAGQVSVGEVAGDLRAEGVTALRIEGRCHGDLRFVAGGDLLAEAVEGDLRIANSASAQLGSLHGNLWAEGVSGALLLQRAEGEARLSDIAGPVTVQMLSGDLRGQALTGGLTVEKVRGDLALSGPFPPGSVYALAADGDIHLNLPVDADVRLTVEARGRIRSDVMLTPAADGSPSFSATLGQGACRIAVQGRGDLSISHHGAHSKAAESRWERRGRRSEDPFAELSNLGDRIRQQVAASLASAGINIETGEFERGRARGRSGRGPIPPVPPAPSERPKPPAPPGASTEEQLVILKMVEEGRITPEEADTLLKALGA